jgi:D-glycero-D-manno-heptose 1,7-bisphosphate phosphatase
MKAVFLDRDGVINRKLPEGEYVTRWDRFELLDRVPEAVKLINRAGFLAIIVTNQRGIARGLMSEADLVAIHGRLLEELHKSGARLDAIYYCPHDLDACDCRKPKTGLFERSRRDFPGLRFEDSLVIGDSQSDIEAGRRLGCRTVLIGVEEDRSSANRSASSVASTLYDAVQTFILQAH